MSRTFYMRGRFDAPSRAFLATPVGDGKPHDNYVGSLFNVGMAMREAGFACDFCIESFNCHVDDARNSMVRQFMQTDCTDLIFIDADVGYEPDDLVTLMRHDADIVAGVYPKKSDEETYPIYPIANSFVAGDNGLLEVLRVPTGFLRIRRHVLEALMVSEESRKFNTESQPFPNPAYYPIFERTFTDGRRWSGDFAFSNKARELGFKIYVDPEMGFSHSGGEKIWTGSFANYIRKHMWIGHPEFVEGMNKLRAGNFTNDMKLLLQISHCWGNNYAAAPGLLMAAYHAARKADGPILETGSGLSTFVMGLAAERSGITVHALEHDLDWYAKVKQTLRIFDIKNVVLHYAPLKPIQGGGVWYDAPQLQDIERFSVVLGDGPQRRFGRDGLFRVMGSRINEALWLFDDAESTKEMVEKYANAAGREIHVVTDNIRSFIVSKASTAMIGSSAA
jgi:hypothetical protein